MHVEDDTTERRVTRWLVTASLSGTAIVCWRGTSEPFTTLKFVVAVLSATAVVASVASGVLRRRTISVPSGPVTWVLVAFLLLGAVSVVNSPSTALSVYGQQGRATGYVLYLACVVLLYGATRVFDGRTAPRLLYGWLGAGVLVAAYAIVQHTGNDPITWGDGADPKAAISTMGNVNFTSGYLALFVPVAVWLVYVSRGLVRALGAASLVVLLWGLRTTGSSQGVVAALAGVAVIALAIVLSQPRHRRRAFLGGFAAVVAAGIALGAAGVAGIGPLGDFNDTGYTYRQFYWDASVTMVADHPVDGVGFDMWAGYFRASRSAEAAVGSFAFVTDEPHSVPLAMFASGGVPLGLAYLAFVGLTGWALLRGLLVTRDRERYLLAAVGGAWVAYQVQSFVSIDMPALPVAHFVTAGLVLGLSSGMRWRSVSFGPTPTRARRRQKKTESPAWTITGAAVAAVVVVAGVWWCSNPVRADRELQVASDELGEGNQRGVAHLGRAADLTPLPRPWILLSQQFTELRRFDVALFAAEKALARDPRSFEATLNAARNATNLLQGPEATKYYDRALELEPNAVELQVEAVSSFLRVGLVPEAISLGERMTRDHPDDPVAWKALADSYSAALRRTAARRALERAVELDPTNGALQTELDELNADRD